MKNSRRAFLFLLAVSLAPWALLRAETAEGSTPKQNYLVFVGTYTTKTASKGIYVFRYDANSGALTPMGLAAETTDPSWVELHPNRKFLYAANEAGKQSTISAFEVDAATGKLKLVKQLQAEGEDPCYLSFDRTGRFLFTANYTSGNSVAFEILPDGTPGSHFASPDYPKSPDAGKLGPNKERQEAPHAHWIQLSRDGHFLYVADLGLDGILVYRFNPDEAWKAGKPVLGSRPGGDGRDRAAVLAPGTGPRHAVFSSDDKFLYVLGELSSTVTVFAGQGETFRPLETVQMLPPGFSGRNDAAEIAIHPNGRFLYASNRGRDSIVLLRIAPATGRLTAAGEVPVGGKEPRHFAIDPSGNYLLAEDQFSDKIVTFRIDQETGRLTPTGSTVDVPSPVCLAFLPVD